MMGGPPEHQGRVDRSENHRTVLGSEAQNTLSKGKGEKSKSHFQNVPGSSSTPILSLPTVSLGGQGFPPISLVLQLLGGPSVPSQVTTSSTLLLAGNSSLALS